MDLKIGDKYKMIKKVGSGAFGEIYKGREEIYDIVLLTIYYVGINLKTGEECAIKLVFITYNVNTFLQ